MTAPARTPVKRLVVKAASAFFIPSPVMAFRASDIWSSPNKNRARPPISAIRMVPTCKDAAWVSATNSMAIF